MADVVVVECGGSGRQGVLNGSISNGSISNGGISNGSISNVSNQPPLVIDQDDPTNIPRQILSFNQNGSCFWNGREITGDDEFREAIIAINRSLSSSMMSENDNFRNAEETIDGRMSMFSSKINRLNDLIDEHGMALHIEKKFAQEGYHALYRCADHYLVVKFIAQGIFQEINSFYINLRMRSFDHNALMNDIDTYFDNLIAHENEEFNRKRLEIGEWVI